MRRPILGVGAVIIEDGRVLLIKRGHAPLKGEWSLPGGGVEAGESLAAAVVREALEETGLMVTVGPLVEVFERIEINGDGGIEHHYVVLDYKCQVAGGSVQAGSDADDARWVPMDELGAFSVSREVASVVARAVRIDWPS